MLRERKFFSFVLVLAVLFAAIMSGGCGGGSSGGAYIPSSEDNNEGGGGWDVPGGDTGGDNGGDTGGGNSPMTPAVITGTWRIESGYAIASDDEGKHRYTAIYKPGRVNELGIEITKNNRGTFGGNYSDKYSLTLSGKNVLGSGITGNGSVLIDFYFIDDPDQDAHQLLFSGNRNMGYRPISNNAYEMTNDDIEDYGTNLGDIVFFKSTLTLVDSSTLHWTYWTTANEDMMGSSMIEGWQELTLKRK